MFESDDADEALLGKATPRPAPPASDADSVRAAVREEWLTVTGSRKRRSRYLQMAIAASIVVVAVMSLSLLRMTGIEPAQVASVSKQFGSVSIIGEQSQVLQQPGMTTIVAGQTIRTDAGAGLALEWSSGGSLRMDENTRVDFLSPSEIFLDSGRIYFDSEPLMAAISGSGLRLTVRTPYGEVKHIGTQFMVHADRAEMTVSVRSGVVEVSPPGKAPSRAEASQQLAVNRSGTHHIVDIRPFGGEWEWAERASPSVDLDGRSVHEFLGWVSHETGMELHYGSEEAESYARTESLNGRIETGPQEALAAWMLANDLDWRMDEGHIYVSKAN
jgi:hypothetical protein